EGIEWLEFIYNYEPIRSLRKSYITLPLDYLLEAKKKVVSKKKILGLILLAFILVLSVVTAQSSVDDDEERVTVKGYIQSSENFSTTWMYGTHVLMGSDNKTLLYALESDSVDLDLDAYKSELVAVRGTVVHEELDGGPPLLKVKGVEVIPPTPEPEPEPVTAIKPKNESSFVPEPPGPGSSFYLNPYNPISVEVLLNKPGVNYDMSIFENAKNVERIGQSSFLYRSHDFEDLAVIVYKACGIGVPGEEEHLSVRLQPEAQKVTEITACRTTFEILKRYEPHQNGENLSSVEELNIPGWNISGCGGKGIEAEYKGRKVMVLSKKADPFVPISTLSIWTKEKLDSETEENILNLLSSIFYLDESEVQKVKEELANMVEEESTRFEPAFKFTDEEARTALKTELEWLSEKGIIGGLSEEDIRKISESVRLGYAGVNSRLIYADGNWISYRNSGYYLIRGVGPEDSPYDLEGVQLPAEEVEIPGEDSGSIGKTELLVILGVIAIAVLAITVIVYWNLRK
ncbi:MAG TPA: hypothetical protein C5S37_05640, partial [Methanophagales archaeon]|nr:hypothetical protein [Methanophagales archaeon]